MDEQNRFKAGSRQEETMTAQENKKNDVTDIKKLLDDRIRALHERNLDVMPLYALDVRTMIVIIAERRTHEG